MLMVNVVACPPEIPNVEECDATEAQWW